jgi:hypothetical protein
MNKKYLITGIIFSLIVISIVLVEIFYDEEKAYQDALRKIDNYRNLCEDAGFVFEQTGNLKSPNEQKEDNWLNREWNNIRLSCYEIRGDVKIYHNIKNMGYIDDVKTRKEE